MELWQAGSSLFYQHNFSVHKGRNNGSTFYNIHMAKHIIWNKLMKGSHLFGTQTALFRKSYVPYEFGTVYKLSNSMKQRSY